MKMMVKKTLSALRKLSDFYFIFVHTITCPYLSVVMIKHEWKIHDEDISFFWMLPLKYAQFTVFVVEAIKIWDFEQAIMKMFRGIDFFFMQAGIRVVHTLKPLFFLVPSELQFPFG